MGLCVYPLRLRNRLRRSVPHLEAREAGGAETRPGERFSVVPPHISIGTPREYDEWVTRLRKAFGANGAASDSIEQIDARYNYRSNRVTLYRLPDGTDPLSIAQTLAHEFLHALLFQMGEGMAARMIDFVARPVGSPDRVGGI